MTSLPKHPQGLFRRKPLRLILLSLLIGGAGTASYARADDAIPLNLDVGLVPLSTQPSNFPNSFTGTGLAASAAIVPWRSMRNALELGYLSQGAGSFAWLGYRYYFVGAFQYRPSGTVFSKGWYRDAFLEIGSALYDIQSTNPLTLVNTNYEGLGLTAQIGLDQPFYHQFFVSPRLGYLNSIGGASFYGMYTLLMVGMPLGL